MSTGKSLVMVLKYSVSRNTFRAWTNLTKEELTNLVVRWVASQTDGPDYSEPNKQEEYTIKLAFEGDEIDDYFFKTDCGNMGLRDGLLTKFVKELSENNVEFTEEVLDDADRTEGNI